MLDDSGNACELLVSDDDRHIDSTEIPLCCMACVRVSGLCVLIGGELGILFSHKMAVYRLGN